MLIKYKKLLASSLSAVLTLGFLTTTYAAPGYYVNGVKYLSDDVRANPALKTELQTLLTQDFADDGKLDDLVVDLGNATVFNYGDYNDKKSQYSNIFTYLADNPISPPAGAVIKKPDGTTIPDPDSDPVEEPPTVATVIAIADNLTLDLTSTTTTQITAKAFADDESEIENADITYEVTEGSDFVSVSETGLVTAVSAGTATVTITSGGKSTTLTFVVSETPTISYDIELSLANPVLKMGADESEQLNVVVTNKTTDEVVESPEVVYAIEDGEEFLSVSPEGLLTAISAGTATVSATSNGVTKSLIVTVLPADTIPEPEPEAPAISTVTNSNLKEIKVTFNTELDKTTAEMVSNYAFSTSAEIVNASLSEDAKTVTLSLYLTDDDTAPLTSNTNYAVTTTGLKTSSGASIGTMTKQFKAEIDSTIPEVASVEVLGRQTLRVVFKEPLKGSAVDNPANWEILDGVTPLTIDDVSFDVRGTRDGTYREAILTMNSSMPVNTYKLKINPTDAMKDFSGYTLVPITHDFEVEADTAPPTLASATVASRTSVILEFSESVNDDLDKNDVMWNLTGSTSTGTKATSVEKIGDRKYLARFTDSAVLPDVESVSIVVLKSNVTDYSGNEMPSDQVTTAEVPVEATPTIDSVTSLDDKTLLVYFSKEVQDGTFTGQARYREHYTFSVDGVPVTSDVNSDFDNNGHPVNVQYDADDNVARITFANALPGGNYDLKIEGVKDLVGTPVTTTTKTVSVTDTTAPSSAGIDHDAGASVVYVTFPERMATSGASSILDPVNYRYGTEELGFMALPEGVEIVSLENDRTARITFPEDTLEDGTILQLGHMDNEDLFTIADRSGNKMNPFDLVIALTTGQDIDISDSDVSVVVTSPRTIEITVPTDQNKFNHVSFSDFLVTTADYTDIEPTSVAIDSENSRKIILTMGSDRVISSDDATVRVRTVASSITSKDILGNEIVDSVTSPAATNLVQPEIVSAVVTSPSSLRISLSDPILTDSANLTALADDLMIQQGASIRATGTALTVEAVGAVGSPARTTTLKISIGDGVVLDEASPVTVKTVASDYIDALGVNSAPLLANTSGLSSETFAAYDLGVTGSGDLAIDADEVLAIRFNKRLNPSSIIEGWDGVSPRQITVDVDSAEGTLTFNGAKIGTLQTDGVDTDDTFDVTISITNNILYVDFSDTALSTPIVVTDGVVSYTPDEAIKSSSGDSVSTNFIPTKDGNF